MWASASISHLVATMAQGRQQIEAVEAELGEKLDCLDESRQMMATYDEAKVEVEQRTNAMQQWQRALDAKAAAVQDLMGKSIRSPAPCPVAFPLCPVSLFWKAAPSITTARS